MKLKQSYNGPGFPGQTKIRNHHIPAKRRAKQHGTFSLHKKCNTKAWHKEDGVNA